MRFHSNGLVVPERHESSEFVFRPLRTSDVELDYDAVVSSSSMLRAWSQSEWPRIGFQLEENLEDLRWHEEEHLEKVAFTYTIMNPKETLCLGCIYVKPLREELVEIGACHSPTTAEDLFSASVRYWVRESHSSKDFVLDVLKAIDRWFEEDWYFDCLVFPVARGETAQSSLYEKLGYDQVGDVCYKARTTHWSVYQKLTE